MKKKSHVVLPAITCSIVLDFMGAGDEDAEQEFQRVAATVTKLLKNKVTCFESKMVHHIKSGSQLVLYDFGGLLPGTNLMEDQSRAVIKYAQDHPSTLILVISDFTFTQWIEPEMESLGLLNLHNVKSWNLWGETFPEWPGLEIRKEQQ